jgi:hypothetical protein
MITSDICTQCFRQTPFAVEQESEQGRLFAKKRQWQESKAAAWQVLQNVGRALSLWKTSIQTVEAKHGESLSMP